MSCRLEKLLIAGFFLDLMSTIIIADVEIVTKSEWNGLESKNELTKLNSPVSRVVIIHTAGAECTDLKSCSQQVRILQHHHMNNMRFDDIAYNFLIGNDGRIYEGRGWDLEGAFAKGYNNGSIGIAFIGNFERNLPSQAALDVVKSLFEEGIALGKITSDYKLYGHRQLISTISPGNALYENVKQWPNWSRQV